MSGLSAGLKNWHWRSKGTKPWAEQWFKDQLTTVSTSKTRITGVKEVEGDSDLGMRKSKLVTIYDLKVVCEWEGNLADGTVVKGTLTALEVEHDMDEDEYKFESAFDDESAHGSNTEALALKEDARKGLADKLRPKFQQFPKAMIEVHGKDLLAEAENGTPSGSGTSTPAAAPSAPSAPAALSGTATSTTTTQKKATSKRISTATVRAESEFQIVREVSGTFVERQADDTVPFRGNIVGKVTSVDPPKRFVQTWRAPQWPENHFGTLTIGFDQGSSSTKLSLELEGVPVGKEDETEKGLDIYYIRSLKQIGSVLVSDEDDFEVAAATAFKRLSNAPLHPWALPGFRPTPAPSSTQPRRFDVIKATSAVASVLVPAGLVAIFAWLLYRGPTFQK
ncbi:Co-chaperone [Cystobasidiomycetes sp. EMM_F5]